MQHFITGYMCTLIWPVSLLKWVNAQLKTFPGQSDKNLIFLTTCIGFEEVNLNIEVKLAVIIC